jgi:protease I
MYSHELATKYHPIPPALSFVGTNYLLPEFRDMNPELTGFRAALVTSHGPELPEFHVPVRYLRDRGALVDVVTNDWIFDDQPGEASGMVVLAQFLTANVCVRADKRLSNVSAADYDAVIILGGAWNPIILRSKDAVLEFIRDSYDRRMLIAAICHGPQVLVSAKVFPARTRATGVEDIRVDLRNAGFVVVEDRPVVYDENERLIT